MNLKLRPYQEASILKLRESISRGNKKILLSASTGSGKSIIIKTIIKNALDKNSNAKILYIVHRNILISQMKETLKEFNIEISTLQKAGRKETIEYDLVLSDESHYGHGSKLFNNIKYKYFLGFTATPICSNGYVLDGYDDIIKIVELIDLVELGYMPPLKTIGLPVIDTNKIKIRNGDFDIKQSFDALNKSIGGGDSSGGGGFLKTIFSFFTKHTGGMVGSASVSKKISPLAFIGAPRFHTGGFTGLNNDEVPIIAKKGEEVLSESDPRNAANGGGVGGTRIINVIECNATA